MNSPGNETIAAIATAVGGGIGIIRVSGPAALAIANQIFRDRGGRPLAAAPPSSLVLGTVSDPTSGAPIDEALAVHMPGGRSYTGEPTAEIQAHGGRLVLDAILQAVIDAGARPAGPGEFTRRAYLAGRLDLTQAEAVAALVAADSDEERRGALFQLRGATAGRLRPLRERLLDLLARVEAALEFEEAAVPAELPTAEEVGSLAGDVRALAAQASRGTGRGGGARVVFAGRPNSGKSSIFNYLLGFDRSIVSSSPGTTRDYVEERSAFGGASVTLIDTAGFRVAADAIEAEGVRRSVQQISEADIVVLVQDGSEASHADDTRLIELAADLAPIIVVSKSDLPLRVDHRELESRIVNPAIFRLSIITGEGLAPFSATLASRCRAASPTAARDTAGLNARHRDALERAAGFLDGAAEYARSIDAQLDRLALELHAALRALGEITGESATDEILDGIFSRFCVGK